MPNDIPVLEQSYKQDYEPLMNYFNDKMSDKLRFITITIKPKMYNFQTITQYEMTHPHIRQIVDTTNATTVWNVEITKEGNVHYHMLSYFADAYSLISFINRLRKSHIVGFYKVTSNPVEHTENLSRSIRYLYKDLELTRKVLHTRNYKPALILIK